MTPRRQAIPATSNKEPVKSSISGRLFFHLSSLLVSATGL